MNRKLGILITAAILLAPSNASAQEAITEPLPLPTEHVRLTSGEGMLRITDHVFVVPQHSHILTPMSWGGLDAEMRRLQEVEIRLTAENKHMRERVKGWQPGWRTLLVTATGAVATGIYLGRKL